VRAAKLRDLVELGSLNEQAAQLLEASVVAGLNIVVAGGTQAGKTTMLNCLAAAIPGGDRVISAEEVFELRFNHSDFRTAFGRFLAIAQRRRGYPESIR